MAADDGIASGIETFRMSQVKDVSSRMLKSGMCYRFMIDMASLR